MPDAPDLTVEILKQIREGVLQTSAEVTTIRHQLAYVHHEQVKTNQRLVETNQRIDDMGQRLDARLDDTNKRLDSIERTMARVARTNDATLSVALEDSGRLDALDGCVRTLETQMAEVRRDE